MRPGTAATVNDRGSIVIEEVVIAHASHTTADRMETHSTDIAIQIDVTLMLIRMTLPPAAIVRH